MAKELKNVAASVKARLKEIARKNNKDFNALCLQYCQERFLYRISLSRYKKSFILKGGLSLLALDMPSERPTKDMDFLAQAISNELENVKRIFSEIITIQENDGLVFDSEIKTQSIVPDAKYEGVRVKIVSFIERARYDLIVDIGFSDRLLSPSEEKPFPVLLNGFENPVIKIYPAEQVIAEKFEAMVKLYTQNSRLKDFYDIAFISSEKKFKHSELNKVIFHTFKNRNTLIEDKEKIFRNDFKENKEMQKQWDAFLKRNKLKSEFTFFQIMEKIECFIQPVCIEQEIEHIWQAGKWRPEI